MSQFSYYKSFASQMEIRIEHLIHFFIALTSTTHEATFWCQIYQFLWNINHECNILVAIINGSIFFCKFFLFVANLREKFNVTSKCCCILISKSIQFIEKWRWCKCSMWISVRNIQLSRAADELISILNAYISYQWILKPENTYNDIFFHFFRMLNRFFAIYFR